MTEWQPPILANSPLLNDSELTTQILQGTHTERRAIAQRLDLNPLLVSHLLSFGERDIAQGLLNNLAYYTGLSDTLCERIKRLGGAKQEKARERAMAGKGKQDFDDLVASMEKDWIAHYHPNTERDTQSNQANDPEIGSHEAAKDDDPLPQQANAVDAPDSQALKTDSKPEIDTNGLSTPSKEAHMQANTQQVLADDNASQEPRIEDFLNEQDLATLEKLGGTDWELLDDDAIEALAASLAKENLAHMEGDDFFLEDDSSLSDGKRASQLVRWIVRMHQSHRLKLLIQTFGWQPFLSHPQSISHLIL